MKHQAEILSVSHVTQGGKTRANVTLGLTAQDGSLAAIHVVSEDNIADVSGFTAGQKVTFTGDDLEKVKAKDLKPVEADKGKFQDASDVRIDSTVNRKKGNPDAPEEAKGIESVKEIDDRAVPTALSVPKRSSKENAAVPAEADKSEGSDGGKGIPTENGRKESDVSKLEREGK